jgi:threonine/homoserine/homoserine lactone efflux protein
MRLVELLPSVLVSLVVVLTPGVDMALVTKNALLYGRQAAVASALGVNAGVAVWAVAAALGLAAVVRRSEAVFTAIKVCGAIYLAYLGVQALLAARRGEAHAEPGDRPVRRLSRGAAFRQGMIGNLSNPKIAVLFTSLLPQFAGPSPSFWDLLLLGAVFQAMGLSWLLFYAWLAARGRDLLARPRVRAAADRVSGVVLIALGVRLALERRT